MDELFAIDAQARTQSMTQTDRDILRQQKAQPLLEQMIFATKLGLGFRKRSERLGAHSIIF
jgi:hypothetical protein